jgi:hypothetical protein
MEVIMTVIGILICLAILRTIGLIWMEEQDISYKIKWTFLMVALWFIAMPYYYISRKKSIFQSN